jgi:mannose/fructose/N-acetylgalactosamine-specific phosphotransferase system component IID
MDLKPRDIHSLVLRLLCLQAPLNCRTMQGAGFLFTLWPWLRKQNFSEARAKAAGDYLNAHPVLASLAAGALLRRLHDGDAEKNPWGLTQWQNSLCGPLGIAGDSLIWDRWKPLVFGLAALVCLLVPSLMVWFVVACFALVVYNLPLVWFRAWGLRTGYQLGARVLDALNDPRFAQIRKVFTLVGAILAGVIIAASVVRIGGGSWLRGGQFVFAFALTWLLLALRWNFSWLIFTVAALTFLLPRIVTAIF